MADSVRRSPGRPALPKEAKRIGFLVYIKPEAMEAIQAEAASRGMKLQVVMRAKLEEWATELAAKQAAEAEKPADPTSAPVDNGEVAI